MVVKKGALPLIQSSGVRGWQVERLLDELAKRRVILQIALTGTLSREMWILSTIYAITLITNWTMHIIRTS